MFIYITFPDSHNLLREFCHIWENTINSHHYKAKDLIPLITTVETIYVIMMSIYPIQRMINVCLTPNNKYIIGIMARIK